MKVNFILISLLALTLTACAGKPEPKDADSTQTAQTAYQQAKDVLDNGLYNRAIELLMAVESRYPFGPLARQVQLDLIYAHYQAGDVQKALAGIDRFIRLNPNHTELDYVYYMRGVSNLQSDENSFQEFFGIDRADRADPARGRPCAGAGMIGRRNTLAAFDQRPDFTPAIDDRAQSLEQ